MNEEVKFKTGQLSGITRIGYTSLYRYVKDYREFFSQGVRRDKRGRRWSLDDLEIVQAIRYLSHERTGKEKIREMLKSGWRPVTNAAYDRETVARLVEAVLATNEQANKLVKSLQKEVDEIRRFRDYVQEARQEVWQMGFRVLELEHKIKQRVR